MHLAVEPNVESIASSQTWNAWSRPKHGIRRNSEAKALLEFKLNQAGKFNEYTEQARVQEAYNTQVTFVNSPAADMELLHEAFCGPPPPPPLDGLPASPPPPPAGPPGPAGSATPQLPPATTLASAPAPTPAAGPSGRAPQVVEALNEVRRTTEVMAVNVQTLLDRADAAEQNIGELTGKIDELSRKLTTLGEMLVRIENVVQRWDH